MESNALTLLLLPLVLFAVGVVAGVVVGWVLGQRKANQSDDATLGRLEALTQSNQQLATEHAAAVEAARLQTSRVQELEERAAQDQDMLRALAPLTDRMRQMQDHVTRLERDRSQQFGDVSRALQAARESDVKLQQVTGALEGSLRSNSARGVWGEMQLRRVVEAAGMLRHVDFTEQLTVTTEQTQVRPDMVVHLPGDQQIVVDAKAPLAAYLEAQEISDPSVAGARQRSEQLTQHAKAVRAHVDALGKKKYWDALPGSPDLVLCFIPVESALAAALETDPTLLDHAAARKVALVSPVSLLASLKAVAFSWRQETLAQDATELLRLSRELYDRLGTMGGHLSKMGGSIRRSVEQYNQLVGSLERRVLPTARKLNDLDPTAGDDERLVTSAVEIQPQAITAPELLRDLPDS
ncbi:MULTISPECIES: DNA recombination protein RmuC [Kocuria]|uniref:DNA recombination protein RmuC n=1 Tax=Kocuria subflava TaxID=1736139 RepID=A0A846TXP9_9MICC|nr:MULTISPECIES: DNA recombination protein RmuC [Kocuria]NKE09987.1 DNA recombination protein RmuC [Kocuria subflava]